MSQHIVISKKERVFDWVNTVIMLLVIILTLYPFWYVIVASVSSISHVTNSVVLLWPDGPHWDAYQQVFRNNLVPTAYARYHFHHTDGYGHQHAAYLRQCLCTVPQGAAGAQADDAVRGIYHAVQRRSGSLLSAGAGCGAAEHTLVADTAFCGKHLQYHHYAQLLPGVPNALYEAASIDGCSYFKYFLRILLPISLPSIATITLTFFHEVYTSIRQRIGVIMCSISKDRLFRLLQNVEGMMVTNAQDILYT